MTCDMVRGPGSHIYYKDLGPTARVFCNVPEEVSSPSYSQASSLALEKNLNTKHNRTFRLLETFQKG